MLGWLDHRSGIKKFIGLMLLEGVPGGAKWRYVWGSCLAFVFSLQVITGIMLMTAYSPSESQAWASVHYIQYKMDFGWLIRGLHHFGSQTMMVLIALHMLQVVIAGAQLPPRELNWWLGIGLLSVTLGLSLTGYLLPWDQKGFWATDVATNIAGSLPEVGGDVKQQAVAGPDSGNHTLTRFYGLHVAILPGALILMLVAHIAIFRRHGVTSAENPEGLVTAPENEHAPGSEPFWPRQAFFDMVACMIVFALMLGAVLYGFAHPVQRPEGAEEPGLYERIARWGTEGKGAELDAAADRETAGYPARPEWYFLFLFQLLKYFPGEYAIYGTVIIPNAVMLVLFLLPLFGIGPLRPLGRFIGILFVLVLFGGVGFLTLKALDDDVPDGILWGVIKPYANVKTLEESVKSATDFQHRVHDAHLLAERACQLAMDGAPVEGGHFLIRNDPFVTGQQLFKVKCAGCHNFTPDERDKDPLHPDQFKFEAMKNGKTAGDLGAFGTKAWIRGLLEKPMDQKYFGLVQKDELDENNKPVLDEKGKVKKVPGLTTMKTWRERVDKARESAKIKAKAQDADFDKIAAWLEYLGKTPYPDRKNFKLIDDGQEAFAEEKANKCLTCHHVEVRVKNADGKMVWEKQGDPTGPDLTNWGSADWIRGMIMRPGHKSRYGERNLMPAFRNKDGVGHEVGLEEFREANEKTPENMIIHLTDIERELIIRWILRDYRPVYGGAPIAK